MRRKPYRVIANNGALSEELDFIAAVLYARELRRLGNYDVRMVESK